MFRWGNERAADCGLHASVSLQTLLLCERTVTWGPVSIWDLKETAHPKMIILSSFTPHFEKCLNFVVVAVYTMKVTGVQYCLVLFCVLQKKVSHTLKKNHKNRAQCVFFEVVIKNNLYLYFEFCNALYCFRVNGNFCKINGIKLPLYYYSY